MAQRESSPRGARARRAGDARPGDRPSRRSAELRPDQKDEDSLPPYSLLDRILEALVDKELSVAEVAFATGAEPALVADIERKLLRTEYKRRQAPPGVKIGTRNFGRDRRYPITNFFHTGART